MRRACIASIVFALAISATSVQAAQDVGRCLESAYPENVKALDAHSILVRGQRLPLSKANEPDFDKRLNQAGLYDQLEQRYPSGFEAPVFNYDPGRMRNSAFFNIMYGDSAEEVRRQLVPVFWAPSGTRLPFTSVNGANLKLEAVGHELAQYPELKRYMAKPNGSFNYRVVAGTQRKSPHSYGMTIDFDLPKGLNMYWRWSGCRDGERCAYPQKLLTDPILQKIVGIFEKHGFIWGGKWYHFDSVHFEYRPELLINECR
ncbi:MAG: M15 family metallopeptidase [Deltaproteobacteria bacterium]|nr:M15 family metallopeptidase [Deltaproteobacteria bacterium]